MTLTTDISKYISWKNNELKSNDLVLHNKLYKNNSNEVFNILRYNKDLLTGDNFDSMGLFRSVIFKKDKLVSYSPYKSMPYDKFIQKYPLNNDIKIQEIVEGTMINLFWNPKLDDNNNYTKTGNNENNNFLNIDGEWEISTRSTVGGNVSYFQNENAVKFRRMFLETCNENKLDLDDLIISDAEGIYSYSFVLQHPENRIVKPIKKAQLYLVAVYKIKDFTATQINIDEMKKLDIFKKTMLLYPEEFDNQDITYESATRPCNNMQMEWEKPGLVFTNIKTGSRCKYRNKAYEEIKLLRGNEPKLQYHYLVLRQKGEVKKYLKYFPENAKFCFQFRTLIHNFTSALYENYRKCYVKKEAQLNTFSPQFKTHMYHLHNLYINNYMSQKGYIGMSVVREYVNKMNPAHLMYALNYNSRLRYLEIKKELYENKKNNETTSSDSECECESPTVINSKTDADGL